MKTLNLITFLILQLVGFLAFANPVPSLKEHSVEEHSVKEHSIEEMMLNMDESQVNCSNIKQALRHYFHLSQQYHSLVAVSLRRGRDVLSETSARSAQVAEDFDLALDLMDRVQMKLEDLSGVIKTVLSQCLPVEK